MSTIPKVLHTVWLGNPLSEEGRKNITDWMKMNPDYEIDLWIDSSLFQTQDPANEHSAFNAWVEKLSNSAGEKFKLRDLASSAEQFFYESMLNKQYYDDEINGVFRNLAAASDILRAEVLTKEGGGYFDVKDIFPSSPLGELNPEFGLLCHLSSSKDENISDIRIEFNNDILASIPNGMLITEFRNQMHQKYQALYDDPILLKAHRNPGFSHRTLYQAKDARYASTLKTSGPELLLEILNNSIGKIILGYEKQGPFKLEAVQFPENLYNSPEHAMSWVSKDHTQLLRNYLRVYFCEKIDATINILHTAQSKKLFASSKSKNRITILKQIKNALNALPLEWPMTQIHQDISNSLSKKELGLLLSANINILPALSHASASLENDVFETLNTLPKNISDEIVDGIKFLGDQFIEEVLLSMDPKKEFLKLIPDESEQNKIEL